MTFTPSLLVKSGPKPKGGLRKATVLKVYLRFKILHACSHGTRIPLKNEIKPGDSPSGVHTVYSNYNGASATVRRTRQPPYRISINKQTSASALLFSFFLLILQPVIFPPCFFWGICQPTVLDWGFGPLNIQQLLTQRMEPPKERHGGRRQMFTRHSRLYDLLISSFLVTYAGDSLANPLSHTDRPSLPWGDSHTGRCLACGGFNSHTHTHTMHRRLVSDQNRKEFC